MYFGEFLINQSVITKEQLDEGLAKQQALGLPIGETLVSLGFLSKELLDSSLQEHMVNCADVIVNDSSIAEEVEA